MERKVLAGSSVAAGLLGLGMLVGSVVGASGAFAQTPSGSAAAPVVQAAGTPIPGAAAAPQRGNSGAATITAKISQADAEKAALAANPGSTVDHTSLQNQ